MAYRILLRRDTLGNWQANNPVLLSGEPSYVTDNGKLKVGDGITPWNQLGYYYGATGGIGATGPAGATGPIGATGPTGIDFSLIATNPKIGTYTLEITDKNEMVSIISNSPSYVVIPADASVGFEYGTKIYIKREGEGGVGITGEGLVIIQSAQGFLNLKYQYSVATLLKNGANTWTLYGDLQ